MRYRHVQAPSGVIHGFDEQLVCNGLIDTALYADTDYPITCKMCKRRIANSRDRRVVQELSALVHELYNDMCGEYTSYPSPNVRRIIEHMKAITEGE